MAKRSQMAAKVHASHVKAFKRKIAAPDNPVVVRERSQKNYKVTPKRSRFELQRRAYIYRVHGSAALETRRELFKH